MEADEGMKGGFGALADGAGKRRLGKGAKPTVFFVAGIFALCRQDLFAFLYLSALPLPCSPPPRGAFDFL